MGGLTIPNPVTKHDPWQAFAQAFFQGMQIKEARQRSQMEYQSEAEDRKIRQQALKLELDRLKLEGTERDRQFSRQSQGDQMDVFKLLSGAPGQQMMLPPPQQEVPGMAMDLQGGMGPSTFEAMSPTQGTPMGMELPHPEMQLAPGVSARPPNLTQVLQQSLMSQRMKGLGEAEAAGWKVGAEERAKAPFKASDREAEQAFDLHKLKITESGAYGRAKMAADATASNQKQTREQQLLDDYRTETKTFTIADDQMNRIQEFAKLDTGPADIGIIFSYMKMMDPESTVREGEYATAQNTGALSEKVRAKYNQLLQGDRLSPAQRAEFVQAAQTNYNVLQKRRASVDKKFQQTANRWGVDSSAFNPMRVDGPVNPSAPAFVKYQGKTVPFAQLPPEVQQQVLSLAGR
jgi:hypothetical protein